MMTMQQCLQPYLLQGLGKTVETIAVLLHRPFPQGTASESVAPGAAVVHGGTLIVTPPAIRRQWLQEVLLVAS